MSCWRFYVRDLAHKGVKLPASGGPEILIIILYLRSLIDEIRCRLNFKVSTGLIPFNMLVKKLFLLLVREIVARGLLSGNLVHNSVHLVVRLLLQCPAYKLLLGLFYSNFMVERIEIA